MLFGHFVYKPFPLDMFLSYLRFCREKYPRSITFYFQNMLSSEVKLNLEQKTTYYYELYILTAGGDGSLTSK